jgi:hypothetical protein
MQEQKGFSGERCPKKRNERQWRKSNAGTKKTDYAFLMKLENVNNAKLGRKDK